MVGGSVPKLDMVVEFIEEMEPRIGYFRSASASFSSCKICALTALNRASAVSLNSGSLWAVKAEAISIQSCGFSAFSAAGKKYRSSIII